jgi:collagen type VII alpha
MAVLKIFDGKTWNVVGLQGIQGITGMVGVTGFQGAQGLTGIRGLQGQTGIQIIMDQMVVQSAKGITGNCPTGVESLNYIPITGLKTTVTLTRPSKVMSLLSLKFKSSSPGSHTVSYIMQSDGETGPSFSEYLPDTRDRSEVMYQVTSNLPIGIHNIQAYWKVDTTGKLTSLIRGDLSSMILEGAHGQTGIQGVTGKGDPGVTGLIGITGAYGGPPGETGAQGHTGPLGIRGVTGPGLLGYDTFVKILPMEGWRTLDVDYDVYSGIPVLGFNSAGTEMIDTTIVVPAEWDQNSDLSIRLGSILNLPLSAGSQLIYQLSYIGFNKTDNIGSLGSYYTDTVTHTIVSPAQFDFVESLFTMNKTYIAGFDYINLKIQKITGTPNIDTVGVCSSQLEYQVEIGVGPTGAQGYTGIIGPTGIIGTQGPTGAFGGPPGETGLLGPTGWQGETGATVIGETGSQGATGLIGITGAFGGPPGETGFQGSQGETGLTGETGSQGYQGDTGVAGIQGLIGATGSQGNTGAQGMTGLQIVMNQMIVERAVNITSSSPTGVEALSYLPITGLNTTVTLTRPGKILSLLYLKYKNSTLGSHTVSFLIQSNGETGPAFSDYLPDTRERSEVIYQTTSDLPAGVHNIRAYWKVDSTGKLTNLLRGDLSSIVLEGSLGSTGVQGVTGLGDPGTPGVTGAFGGPPGETGLVGSTGFQGVTGLSGTSGVTGPGLASFEKFVKILPMESWRVFNVDYDVFGDIPVLRFDTVGSEKIDNTIVTPIEWNGSGDISLKLGVILNTPLSAGAEAILRLSYKGFNKDTNVGTLTPYYTDTVTKTFLTPSQYDFSEVEFTIDRDSVFGYDYIHMIVEKIAGSPDASIIGVCSSHIEHGVTVGVGPTGPIGIIGETGIPGPTGIIGPFGYTGSQGETGEKGDTGVIGIQGPTGAFGGPQGDTGIIGSTGSQGNTGIQGEGVTGFQGVTGFLGSTGSQGTTGIQGEGVTGFQGVTGLIGITGAFGGPQGDTGLIGTTGLQGSQGLTGITGELGLTGAQGHTGASVLGDTGLPGPTGWQGLTGINGLLGDTGETGAQGHTGLIGYYGPTGLQGPIGETGIAGSVTDQPFYNTISRYYTTNAAGEEVWVVSSSTVFVGLTWVRSGTVLTVYSPSHGHAAGNRVIIRNTNVDYQVGLIVTVDTNYFTFTTANSGGTSGSNGAYSLGFNFSHVGAPKTGGTLLAPSGVHADCQLISLRIRTGGRSGTSYVVTVPESAVNGCGANTSLGDCYIPDFSVRADADTLSAVAATMNVNVGAAGYEVFTFGALGTLSRFICLHF